MKKHTSFFVTQELKELMELLTEREEIPKTLFLKRALRAFINGNHVVDARLLITQRTHPDYIRRDVCMPAYIDYGQYEELERIAEEVSNKMKMACNVSQLMFWALIEYCSELAQKDLEGITIIDNRH